MLELLVQIAGILGGIAILVGFSGWLWRKKSFLKTLAKRIFRLSKCRSQHAAPTLSVNLMERSMNANTPDQNAAALLELARKRFDNNLTPAEEEMFRAAARGDTADCTFGEDDTDLANADNWGDKRVIHADRLVWLCTNAQASARVTHRGIQVIGARVVGEVELEAAQVPFLLHFERCRFPQQITIRRADIPALYLPGTHTGPILADGLKVRGPMFLRNGFKAEGEVRLLGATIGGNLDCEKGEFINPDGYALSTDRVKVAGSVYLRNGFKADGEVRLLNATIGGNLECDNGQFTNPNGMALSADGTKVEGSVFLGDGFKAEGEVRLLGATIGGDLSCIKGQFINPGGHALNAYGIRVQGSVFLGDGFKADGRVSFVGATVVTYFVWRDVQSPEKATLDLRSARIATLRDDARSWPKAGNLLLQGLVYDELGDEAPTDAATRKEWLGLQPSDRFTPQPYEQLAKVLREAGHDEDANEILIAKNQDRAKHLPWLRRVPQWLFGLTTRYGLSPWRALWWAFVVVILGCFLFGMGFATNAMVETKKDDKEYRPPPNALVYSIDTFVPLIDLRQAAYRLPDAGHGPRYSVWGLKLPTLGTILAVYLPIHIVLGWILTTLLVVGLTGLIRR